MSNEKTLVGRAIQGMKYYPSSVVIAIINEIRIPELNNQYFMESRDNFFHFSDVHLEPQTTIYKWLSQLDDSQSLHRKWLFHQTSIYKWLFGVPGISKDGFGLQTLPLYSDPW